MLEGRANIGDWGGKAFPFIGFLLEKIVVFKFSLRQTQTLYCVCVFYSTKMNGGGCAKQTNGEQFCLFGTRWQPASRRDGAIKHLSTDMMVIKHGKQCDFIHVHHSCPWRRTVVAAPLSFPPIEFQSLKWVFLRKQHKNWKSSTIWICVEKNWWVIAASRAQHQQTDGKSLAEIPAPTSSKKEEEKKRRYIMYKFSIIEDNNKCTITAQK